MSTLQMAHDVLALGVPFSVALLLAALGENFNQRAGVFNLGLRGDHEHGRLPRLPARPTSWPAPSSRRLRRRASGFALAAAAGVLLGLLFGLVTVTFRAPQGIAGIGLQMLGWGVAGTIFRHFIGGVTGIAGVARLADPGLSRIPFLGERALQPQPGGLPGLPGGPGQRLPALPDALGAAGPRGGHPPARRRHHGHRA